MTKKHFIELADMLRDLHLEIECDQTTPQMKAGRYDQWQRTVNKLAVFCKSQNSQFMEGRWRAYIAGECGKNGGRK